MEAIKNKSGSKGAAATRHHAEAMTIEDLQKIMEWSERTMSSYDIMVIAGRKVDSDSDMGCETMKQQLKHLMMRAFLSSGFTLWTRFELRLYSQLIRHSQRTGTLSFATYRGGTLLLATIPLPHLYIRTSKSISKTGKAGRTSKVTMGPSKVGASLASLCPNMSETLHVKRQYL
jgi:hypothetical protein